MNLTYLKDKSEMAQTVWEIMEDAQDRYPHFWLGWDSFVLMVCWI